MEPEVRNLTESHIRAVIAVMHMQSQDQIDLFQVSDGGAKYTHALEYGRLAQHIDQLEFVLCLIAEPATHS